MEYSVLISVYDKEKPEHLEIALKSMFSQTIVSDDIVIIEDGELNKDLETVIKKYEMMSPDTVNVIRRKENKGLGYSLNEGIIACKHEIIARMDSDDYSVEDRCEKQLIKISEGYDLIGSNIDEFEVTPENVVTTKKMPRSFEEIKKYAKYRNPFNHPSVMYKKQAVLAAGNYVSLYRLEDYDLWVRMIANGSKCCNIDESLVKMRVNSDFYKRRGGKDNLKSHLHLKKYLLETKQINLLEYIFGCSLMIGRAYCPSSLKQVLYKLTLRN